MTLPVQIIITLVILFLLIWAVWRLVSRRRSLPCPSWLAWLVEMENPIAKNYSADGIIAHLDLKPGMKVLDAGCGPGRLTIPLAKAVGANGQVVAIDIQPKMLDRVRAKAKAASLTNIEFQQLAIDTGKLDAAQFDRALLVTVLGEIPDRESALQEIHRSLKSDGFLSITEIIFDPHYQGRATILKLAGSVGFRERAYFGNRISFTIHLEKSPTNQLQSFFIPSRIPARSRSMPLSLFGGLNCCSFFCPDKKERTKEKVTTVEKYG
jgi:ubiquinone/menaquinone biosynthesis C-methylase UbiE